MVTEELKALLSSGSNYIGNINFIDKIEGETINLCGNPLDTSCDIGKINKKSDDLPIISLSDDDIPIKLMPIYDRLDDKQRLLCKAIVLLQREKEGDKYLFRYDNDWWGVYSPLVYDEGMPRNPGTFYGALEELGMGSYNVNCSRDRMTKINGVFLKDHRKWTIEDFYDGYGERSWVFWHKKKIANRLSEILQKLRE